LTYTDAKESAVASMHIPCWCHMSSHRTPAV